MERINTCSITKCLIVIFYFAFINSINAQFTNWENIGPEGGTVSSIVVTSGDDIFVTAQDGVYSKLSDNENWELSNKGLENLTVNIISTDNTVIYAGTNDGVYKTTDNGKTWIKSNVGIENTFIRNIKCINGIVYLTVRDESNNRNNNFYYSKDMGINWIKINTDITPNAGAIAVNDKYIFISTFGEGVFRSENLGITWQQINNGIHEHYMGGFYTSYINANNNFVVVEIMEDGYYISKDNGENWNKYIESYSSYFVEFTFNNDEFYYYSSGYSNGFLEYVGNNNNKISLSQNLPVNNFLCLEKKGGKLYVGTQLDGLFISSDNGKTWNQKVKNFNQMYIQVLHSNNTTTLAGNMGRIYQNTTQSTTWNKYYFTSEIINFEEFFEINRDNSSIYFLRSKNLPLNRSSSQGINWSNYDKGIQGGVRDIIQSGGKVLAATTNGSSELSFLNEKENTWEVINNSGITQNKVNSLIEYGNLVFAGSQKGVFESQNYGLKWAEKSNSNLKIEIKKLLKSTNNIFALTADGIYISNNLAESWDKVNNDYFNNNIITLLIVQEYLFVATNEGKLYLSKDLGKSWDVIYDASSKPYYKISTLARSGDYLLIGTKGSSIIRAKFSDLGLLVSDEEKSVTQSQIAISPNPANDYIEISMPELNKGLQPLVQNVQIFNTLGIEVGQSSLIVNPNNINGQAGMLNLLKIEISNFPTGVYFIKIDDRVVKFVKM